MKTKNSVVKILLAQILLMACATIASAQPVQLLAYTNYTWRYNDVSTSTSNPQDTFMQTGYDDSGPEWKTGRALFGNDSAGIYTTVNHPFSGGINGFATPLDRGAGSSRVTFYFRTHFNVPSIATGATLFTTNYLDDGCVIYINGVDAGRTRVPAGTLTWGTIGSNPATEGAPTRIDLLPDSLVVGDNVLAVEVHQSGTASSDVAFGMNLIMINPFFPQILDANEPADRNILENRSTTLRVVADASPPISYQWVKDDVDIIGATSPTYTIPLMALSDAGNYYARVTNPVGSTNSRTAVVSFTEDTVSPVLIGALGSGTFDKVVVQFNEAMDPVTTVDTFSWELSDGVNPPLEIQTIDLSVGGTVATFNLASTSVLLENTLYTVSIPGAIHDLAGNELTGVSVNFRSFVSAGCGTFLFEAFDTASTGTNTGNAVSLLTTHPSYPNNPRDRARAASLDSRHGYPDNTHEQFGARMRGLFVPNISGPWRFYLASDDAGELWVNPTGPSSAGRQLVARELNCCNNFMAPGNTQTSDPLNLQAGQAYYIEALFKEGTGGDWLKVAARPASEPVPVGGNSDQAGLSPNAIQGGPGPAGILSHITIATHPAPVNTIAGQTAQFSVQLSEDVPACFQWRKDLVDIPGAIGQNYQLITTLADDQAKFSVVVSMMGGTVRTSEEATLTVINDTNPPTALSASTDAFSTNIVITFSEPMDAATAGDAINYQVNAGAIGVTLATLTSPTTVRLDLDQALPACATHTVRITAVQDVYLNVINPDPTTLSFLAPLLLVPLDAVHQWRYNDTGADLGTAWKETGYDDSTLPQGPGVLGFESAALPAPIRTVTIDPRTQPTQGSANYFRTHFNLSTDPSTLTSFRARYLVDDGIVLYINGVEVHRMGMAAGPVIFSTFADRTIGDATVYEGPFEIPRDALVFGDNVLAAEVHQINAGSSDMVFGLELTAVASACTGPRPRLSISLDGNQATITATGAGTIYKASSLDGTWIGVGPAPQTVTIGAGPEFFEIRP